MNLHLNKEEFEELINLTSQHLQIPPSAVRKDYFITYILNNLQMSSYVELVVFKGGTSLSKCYPNSIERFSEDIDLTYIPEPGMSDKQINKQLKAIELALIADGRFEVVPNERNDRNKSGYVWFNDEYQDLERIKLEIGSSVKPHPYGKKVLRAYIHEYLAFIDEVKAIDDYGLQSIYVNVLDIERTYVDKLMSVKRHAICGTLPAKVRHVYDIVKLNQREDIQAFLSKKTELKEIVRLTKQTDSKYLEKRYIPKTYNPLGPYDFDSWKDKLDDVVRVGYEDLHNTLLYSNTKQDWNNVEEAFIKINTLLKEIDE